MKRILSLMLALIIVLSVPVTVSANTVAHGDYQERLETNKSRFNSQRTDEYALNAFTQSPNRLGVGYINEFAEIFEEITKGINSDYIKAKVITEWVYENAYPKSKEDGAQGRGWLGGTSFRLYSVTLQGIMAHLGLPVKIVEGQVNLGYGWGLTNGTIYM